jgi:hypothetical protein
MGEAVELLRKSLADAALVAEWRLAPLPLANTFLNRLEGKTGLVPADTQPLPQGAVTRLAGCWVRGQGWRTLLYAQNRAGWVAELVALVARPHVHSGLHVKFGEAIGKYEAASRVLLRGLADYVHVLCTALDDESEAQSDWLKKTSGEVQLWSGEERSRGWDMWSMWWQGGVA